MAGAKKLSKKALLAAVGRANAAAQRHWKQGFSTGADDVALALISKLSEDLGRVVGRLDDIHKSDRVASLRWMLISAMNQDADPGASYPEMMARFDSFLNDLDKFRTVCGIFAKLPKSKARREYVTYLDFLVRELRSELQAQPTFSQVTAALETSMSSGVRLPERVRDIMLTEGQVKAAYKKVVTPTDWPVKGSKPRF